MQRLRPLWRTAAIVAVVVTVVILVIPLIWPVPELDTVAPERLADPDSKFVDVDGVRIHYKELGDPEAQTTFVLLHGFGASTYSWRDQMEYLADRGRVIAFDRPAFGLTQRLLPGQWDGDGPYGIDANAGQVVGLMDALDVESAWLIGHSAGGAVAAVTAARSPDRVDGLVLEAPAVYEARSLPPALSAILRSPQMRRIGPLLVRRIAGTSSDEFIRSAYADPGFVTAEVLEGYRRPLRAHDWDRALWELVAAPRRSAPQDALSSITAPTLVISGSADTFVDPSNSRRASEAIGARRSDEQTSTVSTYVEIPGAAHLPHEEQPEAFATEVYRFLDAHGDDCGS